jgi:hypothetical protein
MNEVTDLADSWPRDINYTDADIISIMEVVDKLFE